MVDLDEGAARGEVLVLQQINRTVDGGDRPTVGLRLDHDLLPGTFEHPQVHRRLGQARELRIVRPARIGVPLGQFLVAECGEHGRHPRRDGVGLHVPVAGGVHAGRQLVLHRSRRPRRVEPAELAVQQVGDAPIHRAELGVDGRRIHPGATAAALRPSQRGHGRHRRHRPRLVGDGAARHLHRIELVDPRRAHRPGEGEHRQVGAGMTGVGPVLAPRAQADHHQVRSLGPQGRRLEAGGGQPARSEGLHHDVGGVHQPPHQRPIGLDPGRIGHDRALVAVAEQEQRAGLEILGFLAVQPPSARRITAGWLHFDHVGTEVGEQLARVGAGHPGGELDHSNTGQRLVHHRGRGPGRHGLAPVAHRRGSVSGPGPARRATAPPCANIGPWPMTDRCCC